jgi:hypothetical protein
MPVAGGPFIQKTGILLEVDAANAASYPGTGTTWANLFRPGTYNGTLTGSITYNSTDAYGALQFPANNSYVDFGNVGDLSVSWSFQVAVKPAPSASGNYTILSYTSGSGTGSLTFKLDYSSSNQSAILSSYSVTGSTQIVHRVTGSVPTGSWSIINASYGSTVLGMYVNGRPTDYAVTTGSTVGYSSNNRLYIGGTFGITSSFYTGSISSFLAYNTDVSNARIIQNYNAYATRFGLPPSNLFPYTSDPDALLFIDVANITDPTQALAVNNLVIGLKANNLWTKMVAVYPFVGGTAYSHKFNLKSIFTYQVQWFGSISHTSNGVELGNGGYGSVSTLNVNTLEQNNTSFSIYNKTTITYPSPTQRPFIGTSYGPYTYFFTGFINAFGGFQYSSIFNSAEFAYRNDTLGVPGYTVVSRINSSTLQVYKDSTQLYNTANNSAAPISGIFEIGRSGTSYVGTTPQTSAFVTVGQGLSSSETTTLTNLVQAFQTTLGRQA